MGRSGLSLSQSLVSFFSYSRCSMYGLFTYTLSETWPDLRGNVGKYSLKLTNRPRKLLVGRRSFPFGNAYFEGLC